jgi:hypothetical protein
MIRVVRCVVTLSVSLFAQGIVAQVGKAVAGKGYTKTPCALTCPLNDKELARDRAALSPDFSHRLES